MRFPDIARHRAGATFVLIFFLVFAVSGGMLVVDAVYVYRGIDRRAESTAAYAAPLLYLTGAARRSDRAPQLIQLDEDTAALLVWEGGREVRYFCREGALYKQPADGSAEEWLCKAGTLRLRQFGEIIRADYIAPDGARTALLLGASGAGGRL